MAKNQTRRIRGLIFTQDKDAFAALQKIDAYDPNNKDHTTANVQKALDSVDASQTAWAQAKAERTSQAPGTCRGLDQTWAERKRGELIYVPGEKWHQYEGHHFTPVGEDEVEAGDCGRGTELRRRVRALDVPILDGGLAGRQTGPGRRRYALRES